MKKLYVNRNCEYILTDEVLNERLGTYNELMEFGSMFNIEGSVEVKEGVFHLIYVPSICGTYEMDWVILH
jgi:hypothetical protein